MVFDESECCFSSPLDRDGIVMQEGKCDADPILV